MEVVFTFDVKDYQKRDLQTKFPQVMFHFNKKPQDAEVETATVIVTYGGDIDAALLERTAVLEWLMIASAGVEKMPLAEIAERGIRMTNVRGIHKVPMAESVLAHILALRRSLPLIYERQQVKEWNRKVGSTELRGSTALILGPGAIGSEIGRLLQAFGVRTIGCNRSGKKCESMDEVIIFDDLLDRLGEADYVISVLPSTPETKEMLLEEHFKAMKETVVFMNFGRGDLVKESVLLNALKNDEIGHAVLDVFETEPLPQENEFWTLPNCTVSPHVSSLSGKYVERALVIFESNLERWLQGVKALENIVDGGKGY
ncbi:D-2-hydroxyacid dehydrogenase [Sporosarcina limicola]|uniref:Phosphoglycerate dehydrogenase-like enzyme n=1 Tax=Sporosarcina limicola TaxID=34101 RepID=A0A927MJP1_9BACL|nr:D-2-hydroxyacid dehydrogenase [Sporosarcina limicola]MBE1555848.1 phosphoglycerate dehydrogenase-like enzyme [Sporosarcina limicola]